MNAEIVVRDLDFEAQSRAIGEGRPYAFADLGWRWRVYADTTLRAEGHAHTRDQAYTEAEAACRALEAT